MLHKFHLIFTIILGYSCLVSAQEALPIFSDYLTDNYYLIHPSMAGTANCSQIRVTARNNWIGQEDAPSLFTAAINGKLKNKNAGVGAIAFNDKNGFTSQTGAYITYAHHINFARKQNYLNTLSFGLSAGMLQYRLNTSEFITPDPLISRRSFTSNHFNMDFGFSYLLSDFYTHITVKNVLENSGVNTDTNITSNLRNYLLSIGHVFKNKKRSIWYEPSLLFSYRERLKQSTVDLNMKVYKNLNFGKLWGGLSYRSKLDDTRAQDINDLSIEQSFNIITPFIGVNFGKYVFAYTYSNQLGSTVFSNVGFHQLTLGINFSCTKPRSACFCPW